MTVPWFFTMSPRKQLTELFLSASFPFHDILLLPNASCHVLIKHATSITKIYSTITLFNCLVNGQQFFSASVSAAYLNRSKTMAMMFQMEPKICHTKTRSNTTESTVANAVIIVPPSSRFSLPGKFPYPVPLNNAQYIYIIITFFIQKAIRFFAKYQEKRTKMPGRR